MKIILINKFLYPKGGDAISTLATGSLLSSKGHQAIFWGMEHPLNPQYPSKDYFVSYVNLNNPERFTRQIKIALNFLYSFEAKEKIARLIKKESPSSTRKCNAL